MQFIDDSDAMYRLLIQSVVDYAIYMLTPEGIVANWNPGAERAKGYTAGEIVGKNFSLFYSEEERERDQPAQNLEIARRTGRFEDQGWRLKKDGSAFWAHVVIDAIHDDHGQLIGFAKITRDITEKRDNELQLMEAKVLAEQYSAEMASLSRFLDSVISNIPASVIVKDVQTNRVLLANDQAEALFVPNGGSMVGKLMADCLPAESAAYIEQQMSQDLRIGQVRTVETLVNTNRGPRTLRSRTVLNQDPGNASEYVLFVAEDVSVELAANAKIHHMAHHDALTGLPNRVLFHERLRNALQQAKGTGRITATLCLDLDDFKNVNDALGHGFGDKLLRVLSARLRAELRDNDTLARLGGDEFAVILPDLETAEVAEMTAQRLIQAIRPAFLIDGHSCSVGMSIGIALSPQDHHHPEQLMGYADMALYEAKRNGRSRFERFRPQLDEAARYRRTMETDLRTALHFGHLQLHYQPIVTRCGKEISGYEALLRWRHPTKGMIMPSDFISMAEETGLIHEVGNRALNLACQEAASWGTEQTVSVNLSPIQFKNPGLVDSVALALADAGLAPSRLELEITESVLLDNSEENVNMLRALKALGVAISLDDFGTGYSSLGYLRSFPFDRIKIDMSFVREMAHSKEALAIIRAITGMSNSLLIKTTAEGVETAQQVEQLIIEGCSHFQGYFFGRPMPADERLGSLSPEADERLSPAASL
ncbi:sensor domain-containing protein [Pseudomonas asplenii]|uniref:Diguanylate cyclase/phosphodiesterase with PAS/PAC sensor(S) n=1 Tax=Pseudomonas asplenii TaxID=53407 RepID=A0A0M9GCB6_9PSED|nr:EAL domain-containing protein [Pseudomonas fuscovaginae]KPA87575.1 diguanylate cyclase/phosphodiesterase with PAS/PAC sensor(s) [Pseudomonas fuscovaginae]KPA94307.1 diguanylate cyclase/phosphodiesterase with PAS/PAC sensor(s) [Pseudomonas fuscovaginae]